MRPVPCAASSLLSAALALTAILSGAGCSKSQDANSSGAPSSQTAAPPAKTAAAPAQTAAHPGHTTAESPQKPPAPSGPADVNYDPPAKWQKVESPSTMRKATFKIPRAAGDPEDAELAVSQAGGTMDMNVQRWVGQFSKGAEVKRAEKKVGDLKVTVLELRGTYNGSGMPGATEATPKERFTLLGAIVETTPMTFFKMTGPDKTMAAAKSDFDKLVDSLKPR
jgi:hypothetical protein